MSLLVEYQEKKVEWWDFVKFYLPQIRKVVIGNDILWFWIAFIIGVVWSASFIPMIFVENSWYWLFAVPGIIILINCPKLYQNSKNYLYLYFSPTGEVIVRIAPINDKKCHVYCQVRIDRVARDKNSNLCYVFEKDNLLNVNLLNVKFDYASGEFILKDFFGKIVFSGNNLADIVNISNCAYHFFQDERNRNLQIGFVHLLKSCLEIYPEYQELMKTKEAFSKNVEYNKQKEEKEIQRKQMELFEEFIVRLKDKSRLGKSKDAEEMRLDYERRIENCKQRLTELEKAMQGSFPESEKTMIVAVPVVPCA